MRILIRGIRTIRVQKIILDKEKIREICEIRVQKQQQIRRKSTMEKKAYISPETMVMNVKIERLMNAGSPTDPQAHDEEGSPDQFSRRRRRNKWEDEEEDEEEW